MYGVKYLFHLCNRMNTKMITQYYFLAFSQKDSFKYATFDVPF